MGIVVKLESCVEELLHPSTDAVVDGSSAASTLPWQNRPSRTSRLSWAATGGFFSSLEKDAGSVMTWRETKMQLKLKCIYKTKQKTVNNIKAINVCTLIVHTTQNGYRGICCEKKCLSLLKARRVFLSNIIPVDHQWAAVSSHKLLLQRGPDWGGVGWSGVVSYPLPALDEVRLVESSQG